MDSSNVFSNPESAAAFRKFAENWLNPKAEAETEILDLDINLILTDIEAKTLTAEDTDSFLLDYLSDKQSVISDALVMKSQGLNQETE
jgi:hypothetical protein